MVKITYIEHNGTTRDVEAEEGLSVMEAALQNLVPGIDGDCGGAAACATCHVHVDPDWVDKLRPIEDLEKAMLSVAGGVDAYSRLGCQIRVDKTLCGLTVRTPEGQH